MPRGDGTGPMGVEPMTGRGLGICTGANAVKYGAGLGRGRGLGFAYRQGFARGFAVNHTFSKTQKELLNEQKTVLQNQLELINKRLENL